MTKCSGLMSFSLIKKGKRSSEAGFTLVELMITMVVFVLVIAAASQVFTGLLTQFKQQSKIAETNIEGIIGLEIMRQDIDSAGYGLPWVIPAAVAYNEATAVEADDYNDCNGTAPCNPPRAILSGNDMDYDSPNNPFDNSDYLVIKAVNVGMNAASQKSTYVRQNNVVKTWTPATNNLVTGDRVIVISPGSTDTNNRTLVVDGASFTTRYVAGTNTLFNANFAPPTDPINDLTYIVYGVTTPADPVDTALRMPFNRADYYISRDGTTAANDGVPDRCALGTGIFRKTVIAHGNGARTPYPLLDCAADFQVVFGIDTDTPLDGAVNCYVNNLANTLAAVNAGNIRDRVREVRLYVLAHEGQIDRNFTYATNPVLVGEGGLDRCAPGATGEPAAGGSFGRNRDLSDITTDWQNYRWKVYTMVVKPNNLR